MSRCALLLSIFAVCQVAGAQSQIYEDIYDFSCGSELNCEPASSLTEGQPGLYYGTSFGLLFTISPTGAFNKLFFFGNGSETSPAGFSTSEGVLFAASDGFLYGTSGGGGNLGGGAVYKTNLSGGVTAVNSDVYLASPLIEGLDGNFYGIQGSFEIPYSFFRLTPGGTLTTLYTLGPNFAWKGPLLLATDGNFYAGSPPTQGVPGVVYRLTPAGTYSVLHTFAVSEGVTDNLMQASNGLIYGFSDGDRCGSPDKGGGYFAMSLNGDFFRLAAPPSCQSVISGGPAAGFTEASDGNLYGTVGNLIIEMSLTGQPHTLITSEDSTFETFGPGVIQGSDGALYGTSIGGGANGGGFIFRIDKGLSPPLPAVSLFQPKTGMPGTPVRIKGSHLVGLTGVSFNGIAAKFLSHGNNYADAVVPDGATSGPITVTTMNGRGASRQPFQVQ